MSLAPITKQLFQRRRRRKRTRRQDLGEGQKPSKSPRSNSSFPRLDGEDSFSFLKDCNGDTLADAKPEFSCIPKLLEARRSGDWSRKPRAWKLAALKSFTKRPTNKDDNRRNWRPMAKRSIPFRHLGTPPSEAVLALERTGSYVLSLGARNSEGTVPLALALRFFGLPSPAALKTKDDKGGSVITTPLLQTTPLLYEILDESPEEAVINFRRGISPATTPVKILISNDWRVGVAMFRPSTVWTEEGPVGNLVMFALPNSKTHGNTQTIFQCSNVRLGTHAPFSPRNLLWKVHNIPRKEYAEVSDCVFDSILELRGYLLFNDEADGFRLTWVMDKWNCEESMCSRKMDGSPFSKGSTAQVLTAESAWDEIICDRYTGERQSAKNSAKTADLRIVSEAFLHVETLLGAILSARKGIAEVHPEFHYNLIGVDGNGRVADLVITFIRKRKPGSLGVFVQVDLFAGRYLELDWVKSLGSKDASSLQRWCATLALNRRMKKKRSGSYSVNKKHTIDWSSLCVESAFDPDEADDYDPEFWRKYVSSAESVLTAAAPKFVSLSSLYPDCDLITNKAITSCLPVAALHCENSPIELAYG